MEIRQGYSAGNVGNAGGRRGGVERTRHGQKADKTRSGRGKTEGGADKEQSGQDWGGKRTDGQDKELTREGADKGRGGREKRMPERAQGQVREARNGCMGRCKERKGNLSVKWQVARKPRKRRVCLAHELQGGSEKLRRASTTQSGSVAILKRSGIAKGKQQPGSSR